LYASVCDNPRLGFSLVVSHVPLVCPLSDCLTLGGLLVLLCRAPSMYVTFENEQSYPAYAVTYQFKQNSLK
jgi:hypothetical protein